MAMEYGRLVILLLVLQLFLFTFGSRSDGTTAHVSKEAEETEKWEDVSLTCPITNVSTDVEGISGPEKALRFSLYYLDENNNIVIGACQNGVWEYMSPVPRIIIRDVNCKSGFLSVEIKRRVNFTIGCKIINVDTGEQTRYQLLTVERFYEESKHNASGEDKSNQASIPSSSASTYSASLGTGIPLSNITGNVTTNLITESKMPNEIVGDDKSGKGPTNVPPKKSGITISVYVVTSVIVLAFLVTLYVTRARPCCGIYQKGKQNDEWIQRPGSTSGSPDNCYSASLPRSHVDEMSIIELFTEILGQDVTSSSSSPILNEGSNYHEIGNVDKKCYQSPQSQINQNELISCSGLSGQSSPGLSVVADIAPSGNSSDLPSAVLDQDTIPLSPLPISNHSEKNDKARQKFHPSNHSDEFNSRSRFFSRRRMHSPEFPKTTSHMNTVCPPRGEGHAGFIQSEGCGSFFDHDIARHENKEDHHSRLYESVDDEVMEPIYQDMQESEAGGVSTHKKIRQDSRNVYDTFDRSVRGRLRPVTDQGEYASLAISHQNDTTNNSDINTSTLYSKAYRGVESEQMKKPRMKSPQKDVQQTEDSHRQSANAMQDVQDHVYATPEFASATSDDDTPGNEVTPVYFTLEPDDYPGNDRSAGSVDLDTPQTKSEQRVEEHQHGSLDNPASLYAKVVREMHRDQSKRRSKTAIGSSSFEAPFYFTLEPDCDTE